MNGIMLVVLLIGAAVAVPLILLLIRAYSRRGPAQIRTDPDNPSVSQQAASPELILEHVEQAGIPKGAVAQTVEKPAQTGHLPKPPSPRPQPSPTPDVDRNVQFTVYRPATIVPNRWYPLVAFAHLSKRRPNAPKEELDPVEEVRRQAARILSDQPAQYETAKLDRGFAVPRSGMLTFVPLIAGCEFNPPTQSVRWQKTVHKVEFEMTASASVDGQDVEGQMTVYLGNIVLTEIPLRISVDSQYVAPTSQAPVFEEANAEPYRKIFASYSHQDTEIVEDFEAYVQALGDQYLSDVQTLRAGEVWSEALERMIREATVFQLFWSSNSMRSKFVKQEWEYALRLNKPGFIRPVYWEEPLPQINQDLPPAELRRLHFYKFPEITQSSPIGAEPSVPAIIAPLPPPPAAARTKGSAPHFLALIFFVVMGSGVFLALFQTMSKPVVYSLPPPLEVEVERMIQLRTRGDSGEYSLLVRNKSSSAVRNARITEHLPGDLEYVTSDPQPIRQEGPQIIVWQAAEISYDKPFAIRVTIRLRRDLKIGERIMTEPTVTYTNEEGNEKTLRFSMQPIFRRSG